MQYSQLNSFPLLSSQMTMRIRAPLLICKGQEEKQTCLFQPRALGDGPLPESS